MLKHNMKKYILISILFLGIIGLVVALLKQDFLSLGAQPALTAFQGGTGSSSPSGILYGDETIRLKTVTIGSNLTFSGGTLSATAGSGVGTVSTSSAPTRGALAYWTTSGAWPELLGTVATGTVSESGLIGVTAGQSIIGSGLTISLDNIAANTVIGNPTGVSAAPQAVATSTLYGGGVTGGWVLMSNGSTWQPSATATCVQITGSSALCDGNDATGAGGAGTVSTSTAPVVGGLAYWTTTGQWPELLGTVATTSVTCSGNTSCTTFTVLGASPITISSTGGGTGLSTTTPISDSNVLTYSASGAGAAYGTATSSVSVTSPITYSGTLGAFVGGAAGSFGCATCALTSRNLTVAGTANQITSSAGAQDLSADRTWTLSLPNHVIFPSSFVAAFGSTTNATSTNLTITGNLIHETLTSALIVTGSNGAFAEYAAQACTNQFVRGLSALGAPTCATVVAGDVDLADLTATDGTLTFSGAYDGQVARTIGLNLGNANTWTALQQFNANASTTQLSAGLAYFGKTATSTFNDVGDLLVVGSTTLQNFTGVNATITRATTTSFFTTIASSTNSFVSTLLRIPFGANLSASNPGEITHDTTADQLILDDNVIAQAKKTIWSVTVASTSPEFISGTLLPVPSRFYGYTMSDIACKVDSGTSKVIAIEDAGTLSTEDITCATTVTEDDGTITNATVTSLEEMYIDFGATTGVVDYVTITVYGTITRE